MKKLYQEISINKLVLKNRVVMAPMSVYNTRDGYASEGDVAFYRERARGGVGLIVFANMQWDPVRKNPNSGAMLTDEKYIPSLRKVTSAIHEENCAVFAQLMHKGRYATAASQGGEQPVGPSAVPTRYNGFEMPRELTADEIRQFVLWQAQAAGIAKKAGFDGIEIETNSGYLHGQFFSPLTNRRGDEYGGDIHGRTRFMVETLKAIRETVGPDFPVTVRISGNDFVPGSCDGKDMADICQVLDESGYVDGLSITAGWHEASVPLITMELPHATYAYMGREIKKRVNCVVMQGMRLNIRTAEEIVERGDADMAVMGRPFLTDPQLVNKAVGGDYDAIRPCLGCNAGCIDMSMKGKRAGCIINAECNKEAEYMTAEGLLPSQCISERREKILVIGAGPSGMEFARVAALRGHSVTIWEKRDRTMGLSLLAATPPRRYDLRYAGQWLERSCRRLGVDIVLNKEASAGDILLVSGEYDRVVLACGSEKLAPPIPCDDDAHVVHAWDVLENDAALGEKVVVVGGGATGVETAMYIGEIGTISAEQLRFMMIFNTEPTEKLKELLNSGSKQVSVIELNKKFAVDITPGCRWSILSRVKQLGIELIPEAKVERVKKDGVVISVGGGERFIPADTVVMAAGAKPSRALYDALKDKIGALHLIGDAREVAKIPEAIRSAYELAITI